jgi:nitroreductase
VYAAENCDHSQVSTSAADRPTEAVLAEAAEAAGYAPSIHNTQPWRWRVGAGALDLFAARERQLGVSDPGGRLLLVSCGAALHHARTALATQGFAAEVTRLPDPGEADHLARLTLGPREPVTPEAMRLFQSIAVRHTDRRPVGETPVPPADLAAIVSAATAVGGAHVHLLRRDQVIELAAAADAAQRAETRDPQWQEELAYWAGAGADRPAGTGVPASAIPSDAPATTVPGRDFGRPGTLAVGEGHDRSAVYGILYGDTDEPAGWLGGGEALSGAWLTATRLGVSLLPLSGVIEVDTTRAALVRLLAGLGYPYLVLRLGIADPDEAGAPRTPRLPAAQLIDVVP